MSIELNNPGDSARRDRWGRYLVVPPDGGKPVGYTRATTVAKALDDTSNLMAWANRMTALGLAQRPDLLALVQAADPGDRDELNKVCERAKEAGGATARRDLGTALHTMVEKSHTDPNWTVPDAYAADVAAVNAAVEAAGYEVVDGMSEVMVVLDRHRIAGTSDLTLRRRCDGILFVADIKTGATVKYGALAWAVQLAIYAHANSVYRQGAAKDGSEDRREQRWTVDLDTALILHVQPGSGACDLHTLDIAAGAEALEVAMAVREWRTRKDLLVPIKIVGGGAAGTATPGDTPAPNTSVERDAPPAPDQTGGAVPSSPAPPVAPDEPVHVVDALNAVVHQARVAWALRRIDDILAHPTAPTLLGQLWPALIKRPKEVPGGPGNWTPLELDAVVLTLDQVEAQHHMPFGDEDPLSAARRAAENERSAEATTPTTQRLAAPEDGDECAADDDVAWLRRVLTQMTAEQQHLVIGWVRDGWTAEVPWSMPTDGTPTPLRRYEISRAALELAQVDGMVDLDDTGARAALALVIGDDAHQPVHRIGGLLGTLTVDQARALAEVCATHRLATADDGAIRLEAVA